MRPGENQFAGSSPLSAPPGPAGALKIQSYSAAHTAHVGAVVARHAVGGDLIALEGDLGSGKTQFVRGMAEGLGIDPANVSSPTFVLVHEYENPASQEILVHVDAYRLHGAADLESIGWEAADNEHRRGAIVVVEWADRLESHTGPDVLEVRFTHVAQDMRHLQLVGAGSWRRRLPKLRHDLAAISPVDGGG